MASELDTRVAQFVAEAYAAAPGVRAWLDAAGVTAADIQSVADLDKVPILTKARLIELQAAEPPYGGFLGVPPDRLRWIFQLPGPVNVGMADETGWQEAGAAVLRAAGFNQDSIVINTLNYHWLTNGFLFEGMLEQLGATVLPAGPSEPDKLRQAIRTFGVNAFVGTPTTLLDLLSSGAAEADGGEEQGAPPAGLGLRSAILSGEPLPADVRATLVNDYGLTVVNVFSTPEVGFVAYDMEGDDTLELVDDPVVQVVNPATGQSVGPGEVGELVITNLNPTFPLIRFGLGDLVELLDPDPGRSDQAQRQIRYAGRLGEAAKVRGIAILPEAVAEALEQFRVAQFCVVIGHDEDGDSMLLRVVMPEDRPGDDNLGELMRSAVRSGLRVTPDAVQFVESLAVPPGSILDRRSWG